MALDREQRKTLDTIVRRGRRLKATKRSKRVLKRAATQTGLVEQGLHHRPSGEGTSKGWRQETSGSYGSVDRGNLGKSVDRFYAEGLAYLKTHPGAKSWEVAAAVQRPAAQYRGRYRERSGEAKGLLAGYAKGSPGKGGGGGSSSSKTTKTTTSPGVDNSSVRTDLKRAYLANRHDKDALLNLAAGLEGAKDVPGQKTTRVVRKKGGKATASGGRRTTTDVEKIAKLAKKMGLRVGGNQGVTGRPETSGHTSGSYHYQRAKKKGWQAALDISGDPKKMAKLARYLGKRYGKDMEELIYRGPGSKDKYNIKRGKRVGRGFYSAHEDHVHVADTD